jgi:predicted lipid-binding transport protein (Tim44 family)
MKKIWGKVWIALLTISLGVSIATSNAEARRLGGGKSFGMQRSSPTITREAPPPSRATPMPAPAATPTPPPATAAPRTGIGRWMGPLAGLAAGIGLAALLSHVGLGEGAASMLMFLLLALAIVFIVRKLFGKPAPARMAYAEAAGHADGQAVPLRFDGTATGDRGATAVGATGVDDDRGIPAGFDVNGFLRQAKLNFVRLQAANDRGDMADIRAFATPEVAAEIQLQFQERGGNTQQTDIVLLEADLLEIETNDNYHVASVRFHGQLREEATAAPEVFAEIWHLRKPADGSDGWRVAGIQQV